jgi:hypothetical protein
VGIDPLPFLTSLNSLPEMKGVGERRAGGSGETRVCGVKAQVRALMILECLQLGRARQGAAWAGCGEMSALNRHESGKSGQCAAGCEGCSAGEPTNLNRL